MVRLGYRSRRRGFTLVEIMIVVGIISVIIAIAVPGYIRARGTSRQRSCQENLSKIQNAKEQWALENRASSSDNVALTDLYFADGTGYLKSEPTCPANGTYTVGTVTATVTCSISDPPYDHNAEPGEPAT